MTVINDFLAEKGMSKVSELEDLSDVHIEYNVMINVSLVWTKNTIEISDNPFIPSTMESAYLKSYMSVGPIDRLMLFFNEKNKEWVKSQMEFRKNKNIQAICESDYSFLRTWYKELSKNGTEKIDYNKYKVSEWESRLDSAENDEERLKYETYMKRDRERNIEIIEKLIEEIN
jgi:hypothetical protein